MKLTKRTIAATFAAVLIGGFGISPVSAAVSSNNSGGVDIDFILQGLELRDPPFNGVPVKPNDLVAPQDDVQVAQKRPQSPDA